MALAEPYNSLVRRLFVNPVHAGTLGGRYRSALTASIPGGAQEGVSLELSAGVEDGTLRELRFRARACPYLIAAAEWFCAHCEGQAAAALAAFSAEDLLAALEIPATRRGRILLLEDVILLLWRQCEQQIGELD
ncbi:MAG: hypothetical protein ACREQZ_08080 [Woeseiaceae bacterium]